MYLLNKGLDFPSVFVQVVSDTELSCPVEWEERESGPCFKPILDVKVTSYRGHMSFKSPAHRSLQLETEWMCVMKSILPRPAWPVRNRNFVVLFSFLGLRKTENTERAGKGKPFPWCPYHVERRFGVGFFLFLKKLLMSVRKEDKRGVFFGLGFFLGFFVLKSNLFFSFQPC